MTSNKAPVITFNESWVDDGDHYFPAEAHFTDGMNRLCSISEGRFIQTDALWLGMDAPGQQDILITREVAAELAVILATFAETGRFEGEVYRPRDEEYVIEPGASQDIPEGFEVIEFDGELADALDEFVQRFEEGRA